MVLTLDPNFSTNVARSRVEKINKIQVIFKSTLILKLICSYVLLFNYNLQATIFVSFASKNSTYFTCEKLKISPAKLNQIHSGRPEPDPHVRLKF